MVRYRIDVGREHGVEVRDIVGAIANEAGIESRFIGRIGLYEESSTVELPAGMPAEAANALEAPASAACRSTCARTKAVRPAASVANANSTRRKFKKPTR